MDLKNLVEAFREVATASVADAVDKVAGKRGYMDQSIKPRINDKKVVGPAVTVQEGPTTEFVPPQHALDLIDSAEAGSVMVIGIDGEAPTRATWPAPSSTAACVTSPRSGATTASRCTPARCRRARPSAALRLWGPTSPSSAAASR